MRNECLPEGCIESGIISHMQRVPGDVGSIIVLTNIEVAESLICPDLDSAILRIAKPEGNMNIISLSKADNVTPLSVNGISISLIYVPIYKHLGTQFATSNDQKQEVV